MREVVKSPLAEEDLLDIWLYSYGKWGENQASQYLLQLETGMLSLSSNPVVGKSREGVRLGYRSIQINRHVIYYRLEGEIINIVRVLHERMIPEKHL